LRDFVPPALIKVARRMDLIPPPIIIYKKDKNGSQDLNMYYDEEFAKVLDTWGEDSAWVEIQMLLCNCKGKVLDIACGSGPTMKILESCKNIEVHGCDISDFLINKAIQRGIAPSRLLVTDATKMSYDNNSFDYSYSIGSLEHFTEEGIEKFLAEAARVSKICSMHQIPTSKSGKDEGWMSTSTTIQTFHNNSDQWWMRKFEKYFKEVLMLNSKWNDEISYGRWFICKK